METNTPTIDPPAPTKTSLGEWKRHLVNLWQSSEERRQKYWLCRSLGANQAQATRMRDWRLSKIERLYNLNPVTLTVEDVTYTTTSTI